MSYGDFVNRQLAIFFYSYVSGDTFFKKIYDQPKVLLK